jgi:hypothetical protein
VNVLSCWVDVDPYGKDGDRTCYNTCYSGCGQDFLDTSSTLCFCAGHTACVYGCPENCAEGDLRTCNEDCLATLTAADKLDTCSDFCEECVTTLECWTADDTYGDSEDMSCWTNCYSDCSTTLGGSSELCTCSSHGECVMGCPENCGDTDLVYQCNEDCIASKGYANSTDCHD